MFKLKVVPRFSETDALGHISNVSFPVWFEEARMPLFKFFTPDLDPKKWRLILASIKIDFTAHAFVNKYILITLVVKKIGIFPMVIEHKAFQSDYLVAKGEAILVQFAYKSQKSMAISSEIRGVLVGHLGI